MITVGSLGPLRTWECLALGIVLGSVGAVSKARIDHGYTSAVLVQEWIEVGVEHGEDGCQ